MHQVMAIKTDPEESPVLDSRASLQDRMNKKIKVDQPPKLPKNGSQAEPIQID